MSKNHAQMLKHLRVNYVRHKMKYVNEQKKKTHTDHDRYLNVFVRICEMWFKSSLWFVFYDFDI